MRSEKVTINLSMAELGQIDYLVKKGIYASRSDFIRLAIRNQTEQHAKDIEKFLEPPFLADSKSNAIRTFGGVGIIYLRLSDVESLLMLNRKIKIRMLGVLIIDDNITAEQIKEVVISTEVYGKLIASKVVKDTLLIEEKEAL